MSEYSKAAKKLGIKFRIWKWGFRFLPKNLDGEGYFKLVQVIPLGGWEFDQHKAAQAVADDPAFRIELAEAEKDRP